jgi:hypothetical protein
MAGTATKLIARARTVRWLALYETARMVYGQGKRAWDTWSGPSASALARSSASRRDADRT